MTKDMMMHAWQRLLVEAAKLYLGENTVDLRHLARLMLFIEINELAPAPVLQLCARGAYFACVAGVWLWHVCVVCKRGVCERVCYVACACVRIYDVRAICSTGGNCVCFCYDFLLLYRF